MPIYVYEPAPAGALRSSPGSACCHFEILQKISEPALTHCPSCGAPVARAITSFGVKSVAGHVPGTARPSAETPPPPKDDMATRAAKLALNHRCGIGCRH